MDGHQIRNQKTSIIYTLAIAFLLFAASYFTTLSALIEKALSKAIGSDITVYGWYTMITEGPVVTYLNSLKVEEGQPVSDYAFTGYSLQSILNLGSRDGDGVTLSVGGIETFPATTINLIGVPDNLFDTLNDEFYVPQQVQSDFPEGAVSELSSGELNPAELLYSDEALTPVYPATNPDVNPYNAYNMTFSEYAFPYIPSAYFHDTAMDNFTVILPGVFGDLLPVSAGDWVKINIAYENNQILRTKVRALANQVPGFFFTDYLSIYYGTQGTRYGAQCLTSMTNIKRILDNWKNQFPERYAAMLNATAEYEFVDNIPKHQLFVKLNSDISASKRKQIVNGLRNILTGRAIIVLELADIQESLISFNYITSVLSAMIGGIALTIAFFLLLTATTQNINEAIWEYGVLRSIGLTKDEGSRIFFYESFIVVITAGLLGFCVGMVCIYMVTYQFYLFVELPIEIEFPLWLFIGMVVISMLTTFFSVYLPMKSVRSKPIGAQLKGTA